MRQRPQPNQLKLAFGAVFEAPPPPPAQLDFFGSATPIEDNAPRAARAPKPFEHHRKDTGKGQLQLTTQICERCGGPVQQMRRGRRPRFCSDCRK